MGGMGYGGRRGGSTLLSVAICLIVFAVLLTGIFRGSSSSIPASTYNREKAETGVAYQNDCIVDELGWFTNIPQTERRLQAFYDATGVQPYIVLKAYDSSLTTDAEKEAYANDWYEANIDNEGTFLYMYFAEADADNDVGYMCYVNGKQVTSVMDAEAVEIFWAYLDNAWYSDQSTDDLFVSVFTNTADRIMKKTTTGWDIAKWVVIGGIVTVGMVGGIYLVKVKHRREKERAEETERILHTPLESAADDLAEKYEKKGE